MTSSFKRGIKITSKFTTVEYIDSLRNDVDYLGHSEYDPYSYINFHQHCPNSFTLTSQCDVTSFMTQFWQ